MNGVVLKEKFRTPAASGLPRERLEKLLQEGTPGGLTLLLAPPGSGKTTLLSRVAASSSVPVGWYRLTADDAPEHRLVAHLARALAPIATVAGEGSIDGLLGSLDEWNGVGLLILDDLHEIAGTPSEKALERLVSLRPPSLRLIFGSRRVPEINVPRMRASGAVREIGSDDLRFRTWEVEELFSKVYQQPLRPDAVAALTRRTGGWAAGLQLFHLSTAGRGAAERHQAVADLGGRSKLVRSYLTRNVLAELPEDRRRFLLCTCALGRLSGLACDALLGISGSHRILQELENAQLFTLTDDGGNYFRYHEILQTHLELALVEEFGLTEARSWYSRSGDVLASMGDLRHAARAYAKAENWHAVSTLVQRQGATNIDANDLDGERLIPAGTWQQDPWLALASARRLVREGSLPAAFDAYQHARSLFDEPNYQQLCRSEREALAGWLPGSRRVAAPEQTAMQHWSVRLREALRVCRRHGAASWATATTDSRSQLVHGLADLAAGEIRLAREVLEWVSGYASTDAMAVTAARLGLAVIGLITGESPEAALELGDIGATAEDEGLPWLARLARGLHQIAQVDSQDRSWWRQCCNEIIRTDRDMQDVWGAALLTLGAAVAKQHLGDPSAEEDLDCATAYFDDLGAPVLALWCRLMALRAHPDGRTARDVAATSRALGMPGAEALAMAVVDSTGARDSVEIGALSSARGIPLERILVTPDRIPSTTVAESSGRNDEPVVRISCLGGYRLEVDGREVDVSALRPQARSVLQLLSLFPDRNHRREFLEDLLWPGVEHSVASHRLQVAISSARSLFATEAVGVSRCGDCYRLSLPANAHVDVVEFEKALTAASASSVCGDTPGRVALREKAISLYTGDLLPETGSIEYVDAERHRLRRLAAAAAAALAADYRRLGEDAKAMEVAQWSVGRDPEADTAWLMLAELHEDAGDHASAAYYRNEQCRMQAELAAV
jgi:DNA-binding SARP family transcriptional activator